MSDEQNPSAPEKKLTQWKRQVFIAVVCLFVLFLVYWSSQLQREATRRREIGRGVDAVATLLTRSILENNPDKLRQTLGGLASNAHYQSVTVTNSKGDVLASTDALAEGKTRPELVSAPTPAEIKFEKGRYVVRRAINLGEGNQIGGLEVQVAP